MRIEPSKWATVWMVKGDTVDPFLHQLYYGASANNLTQVLGHKNKVSDCLSTIFNN